VTLWGGRFDEPTDETVWAFTTSPADRRMLEVDVVGSIAHVTALGGAGILPDDHVAQLTGGLEAILAEVRTGSFEFSDADEDVHSAVERRLGDLIGPVAGTLHTGRSRNDQVALDLRLYLLGSTDRISAAITRMVTALVDAADAAGEAVVPSYTHLQHAQAVPFAHHLLAHAWALLRDRDRFAGARTRLAVSPLGAGAGGGSRMALDPAAAAGHLGVEGTFENSLDAVAARDQATEYAFCCAQTLVTLSRLAEEIVLWSSTEFGWMTPADRHATGSSAMPHKKNPDPAELARGKAGSAIGRLAALLTMMKGLPLAYNRDMQEDKEHLFTLGDDVEGALVALAAMIAGAEFTPGSPSADVTALDLAEVLVERGVPFREAHEAVGRLVSGRGGLGGVSAAELAAAHGSFAAGDEDLVDPVESVRSRRSPGGGSFDSVRDQIARLRTAIPPTSSAPPR
jgi:argininosuccinate lyase